jgi:hypothetical protein
MANDLNVEHDALKARHALTVKQLTDTATHRADLQLSFTDSKQAHEYEQLETEKIKNELAQTKALHQEEVKIYTKKVDQQRHELDIAQMPLEDLQA